MMRLLWLPFVLFSGLATAAAGEVTLLRTDHDPYGTPRPVPEQKHVPLRTSFYLELGISGPEDDAVLPESVTLELTPQGHESLYLLRPDRRFASGYTGWLLPASGGFFTDVKQGGRQKLLIYIDSDRELLPSTAYTLRATARSRDGMVLPEASGTWQFTTETVPAVRPVEFSLALDAPVPHWHGGAFTGICGCSFGTNVASRTPTFELMQQVRQSSPTAWSARRDFWLTGMEHQPGVFGPMGQNPPNIVRERETRRISKIDTLEGSRVLHVEDFFGHRQYGIPSNRRLSEDYHVGDEVLVADGDFDARAKVLAVDDDARTVGVSSFNDPPAGWKLEYSSPLPTVEDADSPGLFPPGGTYLRKFSPAGTPAYYWGRLDREWDQAVRRFNQRLIVNFQEAPGDLSIDGRNWTTAKDYAELHEAVRAITSHLIDRYGEIALTFTWSAFNEPDLGVLFWRSDWDAVQKFYDYTVDGVLRAFEEHGLDSQRVFIGGLELGAVFGTNMRLQEFLTHCAPRGETKGALLFNAAYADKRLDGRRSQRVEKLCRDHHGRGTPCDFISIHAYNRSQLMADKLARAKEIALEIDSEYYDKLWINSHESTPAWSLLPDPAYGDSYLGNGYFETWCVDVFRRRLDRAAKDGRYAYGESLLTYWPWWPTPNFGGGSDFVRELFADDTGDGRADRTITVANPILHFLGLVCGMGNDLHVLPEQTVGGHVVSGFAARSDERVQLVVYAHDALDIESRSQATFDVALSLDGLKGLAGQTVNVEEYRFDADHNSFFRLARSLRDAPDPHRDGHTPEAAAALGKALRALQSNQTESQLGGLQQLRELGPRAATAFHDVVFGILLRTQDAVVRAKANETLRPIMAPATYSAETVRKIKEAAALGRTAVSQGKVGADSSLKLTVRLAGNGANFVVFSPKER